MKGKDPNRRASGPCRSHVGFRRVAQPFERRIALGTGLEISLLKLPSQGTCQFSRRLLPSDRMAIYDLHASNETLRLPDHADLKVTRKDNPHHGSE